MENPPPLEEAAVKAALSSPAFRRIVIACIGEARSVKSISEEAGLPLASIYRQVKSLVHDGVLVVERSAITPDGKPYDLFRSRLARATMEVGPAGVVVRWEVDRDIEARLGHMWRFLKE